MAAYAERAPGGPEGGQGPLAAAFAVALLLHLAALAGLALMRTAPPEATGEQQITLDLSPAMEEAPPVEAMEAAPSEPKPDEAKPEEEPTTVNPVETQEAPVPPPPPEEVTEAKPDEATPPPPPEMTQVMPEEVKPPPPTEMTQVMPEEVQPPPPPPEAVAETPPETPPPPPEEQVITSQAPEAEPLAPPPPAPVKEVKPKPKEPDPAKIAEARRKELLDKKREAEREAKRRELIEAKREEKREEIRKAAAKAKAERDAARRKTDNAQGASQQNQRESRPQRSGGGDPNALAAWKGMLSSTIRGRMNRGAGAGTGGGVATVRFTVSRSGAVTSASLVSSSGIPAIDAAALSAVRGSLPPAPAGFDQQSLSVTVPMRFGG
ncbi:protein TonB [Methylorubrum rhodinum]|uniref:Protein TonB n=1 Tax=Methylorubrum rhodinum TaxID=29428 RepID=A0A840ZIP4_9HYPH|nr:energy transducer TonB [Methylorubrum rhodinum]MBB5756723.1 protein TonB [Methylorubrum rhodinum]